LNSNQLILIESGGLELDHSGIPVPAKPGHLFFSLR
jgi:hypothetical protein